MNNLLSIKDAIVDMNDVQFIFIKEGKEEVTYESKLLWKKSPHVLSEKEYPSVNIVFKNPSKRTLKMYYDTLEECRTELEDLNKKINEIKE